MRTNARRRAAAVLAGVLTVLAAGPAPAQTGSALEVKIREISFDSESRTRVVVSVAGTAVGATQLGAGSFALSEQGTPVTGLSVEQLFESKTRAVAVALVLDVSNSTAGAPLAAAKAAAKDFANALPPGVRIGVFEFGSTASKVQDFTVDRATIATALDSLQTGGRTSLYDGVVLGSEELDRQLDAQRNMVVFSDGNDSSSEASLSDAVSALKAVTASATTVLLTTERVDERALQRIAAAVKGGRFLRVEDTAGLTAAFERVAQAISSQYVLTYKRDDTATRDLQIGVSVTVSGFVATDQSSVLNQRSKVQAPSSPRPADEPLVPAFASRTGYYVGIGAAFAGVLLFLGVLLWAPRSRGAERMLARRLRLYSRTERKKDKEKGAGGMLAASRLGRRAVELVEKVPRSKQFDERIQKEIDRAGWPLRTSEFVLIQLGAAVAGVILGAGLFQRWWLGIALAIGGGVLPRVALANRMAKRTGAFLEQLPDTLQLLAGSLQAGYGFLQALDTVSKEAQVPTSTEFSRVLAEARLGMPLDEALDAMADRVGGEDFRWVVLAINIQRQVGGNLAALLTTVANTLREREMVRRQIKVLSAEGRLSAIILVALPFVLFGYLSVVNPDYIGELTKATVGKVAIVAALVLIGVGAAWMRKIIKIDV